MTMALSLATVFGKTVAEKIIGTLGNKKDGVHKLELAAAAIAQGTSAIDALKRAFGKEFLSTLNEALGTSGKSRFSYEAGTQSYIKIEDAEEAKHTRTLRDELNINLDRLALLDAQAADLMSQFRGLMSVWQTRCLQRYSTTHEDDIRTTFQAINQLLKGKVRNYKQTYKLLSATSLGGVGSLLIIAGVLAATGTGGGIVAAISYFLIGVPWLAVGTLVLPGLLLVALAALRLRPADEMTISISLAYKLLDRIDETSNRTSTNDQE